MKLPVKKNWKKLNAGHRKTKKRSSNSLQYRKDKYSQLDGGKEHRKNKRGFLSNATPTSNTGPDARIAKKNGKPRMLCYSSAMSVDTHMNVITHMSAEFASQKDSRLLLDLTEQTMDRLEKMGWQLMSY